MLSFYTPISYDYDYALTAIRSYYEIADEIILGVDIDNISWSQKKFDFDNMNFVQSIKKLDSQNKIKIISGNFHEETNPLQNETNERNLLSQYCSGYIIAIDSDEVLLNPIEFKQWMINNNPQIDIECLWYTAYKKFDNQYLITWPYDVVRIGTPKPNQYTKCRSTANKTLKTPLKILHHSWDRSHDELRQKLSNWGHSKDIDIEKHLAIWDSVTLENYHTKTYLHPLGGKNWWQKLELLSENTIEELLSITHDPKGIGAC